MTEKKALSVKEAMDAMRFYLEAYYSRTNSDDIGDILSDIRVFEDGGTADPAAWEDWIEAVEKVKGGGG